MSGTVEQTAGPYYFGVDAIRGDIREDRAGVPLRLGIRVLDAATCAALPNVVVDIWHCDAEGRTPASRPPRGWRGRRAQ